MPCVVPSIIFGLKWPKKCNQLINYKRQMGFLAPFPAVLALDDVKIVDIQRHLGLLYVVVSHSIPASSVAGGSMKLKTSSDDSSVVE